LPAGHASARDDDAHWALDWALLADKAVPVQTCAGLAMACELADVLLTPQRRKRTKQVEAAVDRCEAWECVDELVTIVGTHLR
jgi:hypothetical protein